MVIRRVEKATTESPSATLLGNVGLWEYLKLATAFFGIVGTVIGILSLLENGKKYSLVFLAVTLSIAEMVTLIAFILLVDNIFHSGIAGNGTGLVSLLCANLLLIFLIWKTIRSWSDL